VNVYTPPPPPGAKDTLYFALYDSIKAVAQQFPNLNRYLLKGSARTSSSSDISIGYNIPPGSVTVTAGGQILQENLDYTINYDLGTIKIINAAITNAGLPVQVNFENNASFGIQQRNYMALRLDYLAKNTARSQLSLGATMVRLGERPFFTKVDYGEDPIRNTMYGMDLNYRRDVPRLTKFLDKLPFYSTTAPSSINAYVEGAYFDPGHAPQIGKGKEGLVYIDNFEGSKSSIDLRFPPIAWALASTPFGATARNNPALLFPEASANNQIIYGRNRAKIAWYQIEPTLQDARSPNNPIGNNKAELSDPRVRAVSQSEIFPQRTTEFGQNQLITFDIAYYPEQRGPYNYDAAAGRVGTTGKLLNPKSRWGGLMRSIDQTDFETGNVEFIEAWIQDPFITKANSTGGKFYINLGNVSEDVLKDSRRFYENGLPTPNAPSQVDTSTWGRVPRNPIQVTNAFSNDPEDRPLQDVGFDGLGDEAERLKRQADYLNLLLVNFGAGSAVYQTALADPSSDNYVYYRGNDLDARKAGILSRYQSFNNPQGNSPVSSTSSEFSSAATLYPDQEDLNRDNTLNETEEYFQYIVDLKPPTAPEMSIGTNYIVDKKIVPIKLADGSTRNETWYQFRIPINAYHAKVGNIPDFKSIRFIRMFMTDFQDTTVVRLAKFELVRNIWRRFQYKVDSTGTYAPVPPGNTAFNVGAVNIEENDKRTPLPYRTPKEIERVQTLSNNGVNLLQNEQSLTLQFCDLLKKDSRAVFQTFANRDLRQFRRMKMFIHAERNDKVVFGNDDLTAVFRMGTDFVNNYYEIRIPLKLTPLEARNLDPNSDKYNDTLWNARNSLDLDLQVLTKIKAERNLSTQQINRIYSKLQSNGHTYSIMGNPNLGEVRGILLGVENTNVEVACGELWFNELRLSSIDERGGWAALGRVDVNLADLGTLSISANAHSNGFGTLEQRVNERYKDHYLQFDAAANLELGKLLPKKLGLQVPVYASYSQTLSTPEYDPYDLDIRLKDKLKAAPGAQKDSIKKNAIDFTSIKTVNFTNVRKVKTNGKKPRIYDIENIDLSYSYVNTKAHNPLIENNEVTKHRGGVGYNYSPQPKYFEPFKKLIKSKTHWFDLIKDFNINPLPSQLSFKADVFRQFGAVKPRSVGDSKYAIPETYDKFFTFDRNYIMRWDLTRSFNVDYSAVNNARIDEPYGRLDTKEKKDTIKRNFWKGGRNVVFNQAVNFSYNLPTTKFPLLDWTTVRLRYGATYRWIGASRLAVNLGNILENGQQQEANAQLDFTKLYSKSKLLRSLDQPVQAKSSVPPVVTTVPLQKDYDTTTKKGKRLAAKEAKRLAKLANKPPKKAPELRGVARGFAKILTSLKTVNVTLSENSNTRLPGYTDSTQYLGQNFKSLAPGFDFILGKQPDTNWLNQAARKRLITRDTNFNDLFLQNFDQRFAISAQLEPIRDLTIDVNLDKTFNKNYTELFKDTTGLGTNFGHLSPYAGGGFNVSYIAFSTLFEKYDPNRISKTFLTFQDHRKILSSRLAKVNPYNQQLQPDGYFQGYGRYAVDVLIPAFIAAYTGQDPNKVALIKQTNPGIKSNPFKSIIPKPNWRLTYNGLNRIKGLEKVFTSFSLTHGYTGSLSMNSFTSALLYQDVSRLGFPSFIDTLSNNYVPFFLVPNVTIQEQFSPLIGIDFQLVNQVSGKFEYVKQRQLSLSLIDYQLSEVRSTEFTVGAGWRKRGLKLPFKIPFSKPGDKTLENELNIRFDFKIRDNVTSNSRLDQESAFATNGSKEITISPTIDYYINNRINLKLYFDQRRVNPYISSAAPTVNTRAGLQIRISLTQ
ncbi:MAG: cell surface protein SprA, partial [Chitinophagaceae bacterium]